ncbi:general transcription repressor [Dimargaris cristalligena]|nr:general transcription repressor [Dimargaris cristalligena]
MSGIYNHRAMVPNSAPPNRIPDLLEALKVEYDNLTQEVSTNRGSRDDPDGKGAVAHISEMTAFQQQLSELQRNHLQIKQKYEDEVARLQKELELRGGPSTPSGGPSASTSTHPQPPPPAIGHGQTNMLDNVMSVSRPQAPGMDHSPMGPGASGPTNGAHPPHPPHGGYPGPYSNGATTPQQHQKRLRSDTSDSMHPGVSGPYPQPGYTPGTPHEKGIKPVKPLTPTGSSQAPPPPGAPNSGGPPAHQPTSQPLSATSSKEGPTSTVMVAGTKRKTSGSSITGPPPRPMVGKPPGSSTINDVDPNAVPSDLKVEGADWFAIFNPKLPRNLNMGMVHSLDHKSVVCCVRFSNDGKFLATGCNRTAQIFDVNTGDLIITLNDESVSKDGDLYIRSVCFSPDGKFLATGAEDKLIRIWELATKRICHTLRGHEQDIYSLDYSRDGQVLVSGSGDRTARLWDTKTGNALHSLATDDLGPKDAGVTSVAISPDGRYVAAGSLDRMVRVWDAQSGYMWERLEGHKDSVYSVAFTPDGNSLISGSLDKTIKVWDLGTIQRGGAGNNPPGSAGGPNNPGSNGSNTPNSTNPSSGPSNPTNPNTPGSNSGTPKANICRSTLVGHKDFVLSVACSPCGRWIVSGSKDRSVQFWETQTSNTLFMLQGHKNSVISVCVSPAGGLFATGSGDCRARIWRYDPLLNAN